MVDLRRHDVLEVENWNTERASAPGTWPCGVCRAAHPVADSWYVEVETGHGLVRLVACGRCAARARQHLDDV